MSYITIPKCNPEHTNYPCWIPTQNTEGKQLKPLIRCNCGTYCGIGLHHVHPDGRITNSFWHHQGPDACGWHVHLQLEGYDRGEFLPNQE